MGHLGLVFHIQTEDSGSDNPHIYSHLFHEGVILATRKVTYDGEVDAESVRVLMKDQHVALLKALRAGQIDDVIAKLVPAGAVGRSAARAQLTPAVGMVVVRPAPSVGGIANAVTQASDHSLDDVIRALLDESQSLR